MTGPNRMRIVESAGLASGYGCRLLAATGADVIKVEPPEGDLLRQLPPFVDGVDPPESSLWFAYHGAGRRSVVVDDVDQLAVLVASADVVIDDGSLEEKLGTPAGDLTENNPSLTWIAISPFGRTGPRRNWRTSNLVAWASSSITYTLGFPDRPPVAPAGPVQLAYHYTSMYAAVAAQLAVRRRKASERGQLIDMSIQEACLSIAPEVGVPVYLDDQVHRPRAGNRRAIAPPVGLYPCEDGYVSIIGLQPAHWRAIAEWIHEKTGNEGVTDEVFLNMQVRWDSSEVINEWTEELCALLTKAELFEDGQRRGIPLTPVNTVADLADDPHLAAVGFFTPVDHPQLGEISIPGAPLRDNCGWWTNVRAPLLGEHTQEILSEL